MENFQTVQRPKGKTSPLFLKPNNGTFYIYISELKKGAPKISTRASHQEKKKRKVTKAPNG